jgi:hypothetical protein
MTELTLNDTLLHRYYDGDLDPEMAAAVEAVLATDEKSREKLDALEQLGEFLRAHGSAASADLDADGLFASIEANLENSATEAMGPDLLVIPGGAPSTSSTRAPGYIMLALAAAALMIFFIEPSPAPEPVAEHGPYTTTPGGSGEAGVVIIDTAPAGSEVLAVDFGSSTGTAFSVEGDVGQPVAVLWISDEETTIQ